jgi:hypothetical protein
MMRWLMILGMLILPGCGPGVDRSDLGELQFEVPKVPGADEPYDLKQLGPPPVKTHDHDTE